MHIGQGSPWLAVLVGFPFALLMIWVTLFLIARFAPGRARHDERSAIGTRGCTEQQERAPNMAGLFASIRDLRVERRERLERIVVGSKPLPD